MFKIRESLFYKPTYICSIHFHSFIGQSVTSVGESLERCNHILLTKGILQVPLCFRITDLGFLRQVIPYNEQF